jgi:hypothetical protein
MKFPGQIFTITTWNNRPFFESSGYDNTHLRRLTIHRLKRAYCLDISFICSDMTRIRKQSRNGWNGQGPLKKLIWKKIVSTAHFYMFRHYSDSKSESQRMTMDHADVWKKLIRKIWVSSAHSTDDAILRIITKAKTLLKKLSTLLACLLKNGRNLFPSLWICRCLHEYCHRKSHPSLHLADLAF